MRYFHSSFLYVSMIFVSRLGAANSNRIRSRAIGMLSNCLVLLRSTSNGILPDSPNIFNEDYRNFISYSYTDRVAVYSARTERGSLQRRSVGIVREVDTNFHESLNRATSASHLATLCCNFSRQLATREKKRGRRHGQQQG